MRMMRIALYALQELEEKIARGEPLNMGADDVQKMLDAAAKLIDGSRTTKVN
jgi:hypothetical protein